MITLENNNLRIDFDERGRITSLRLKSDGNREILDHPAPYSFFMNLADDRCKECLVFEENQEIRADVSENRVSFHMERLKIDNGRKDAGFADISLTLHAALEDDSVVFTADVDNRTDSYVLDFEYPNVGVIKTLGHGKPTLFWPTTSQGMGTLYMNAGEYLSSMKPSRENGANSMNLPYPGRASVGTYGLIDRKNSLFIASEDPDFIACELKIIGSAGDRGAMLLTVDRHLCCKHTSLQSAPIRLRLYRGDWHYAARGYAAWMEPYRPKHPVPRWIREMTGYFLVINKQQFGYEMWNYDTLPQLYELAQSYGFDTLGLFGWYESGHDNQYPDLEVADSLGGELMLRENIRRVQDAGGHVTLYFQGHLIDIGSQYYRSGEGKKIESINIWGEHYTEQFPKSHRSTFLRQYSGKRFSLSCPSCPDWIDLMLKKQHWIASLGADAALYDQIGGMEPYPCFNESHPHDGGNPARSMSGGRRRMMKHLQTQAKEISPDFAFMSEHFNDLYSANLDCVHGSGHMPGDSGEHIHAIGDERGIVCFPDFARYAFPETVVTGRCPSNYQTRRYVNYTFLYNLIPEMEIRYKADRDDLLADTFREERLYSAEAIALRNRYRDRMSQARYTDTDGITSGDTRLLARGYTLGDELLITLWNDSDETLIPQLCVDGMELICFERCGGELGTAFEPMTPQQIAMAVYRRKA
ncbi:MAG: hypothetical protein E7463_15245 [Ruminococcaceae bacterium]|nr:hypothetical protein [Oscillospiraceae bacterium]